MMCRMSWSFVSCFFLLGIGISVAKAQQHRRDEIPGQVDSRNCYDPNDVTEIRLWEGRAPGAIGDDPCRDIPYLKIYRVPDGVSATRTAVIVMPGGGYDRLIAKSRPPSANISRNSYTSQRSCFFIGWSNRTEITGIPFLCGMASAP
jgi:hypothetical protein